MNMSYGSIGNAFISLFPPDKGGVKGYQHKLKKIKARKRAQNRARNKNRR
jgi:hypothetical protein